MRERGIYIYHNYKCMYNCIIVCIYIYIYICVCSLKMTPIFIEILGRRIIAVVLYEYLFFKYFSNYALLNIYNQNQQAAFGHKRHICVNLFMPVAAKIV